MRDDGAPFRAASASALAALFAATSGCATPLDRPGPARAIATTQPRASALAEPAPLGSAPEIEEPIGLAACIDLAVARRATDATRRSARPCACGCGRS